MTNLLTTITEEAVKRFEERFNQSKEIRPFCVDSDDAKEFIKSELSIALETVKKEVGKMKVNDNDPDLLFSIAKINYNKALSQVLDLLNTQEEKKV